MPVYAVKRCCLSSGCPNLVERGYCSACQRGRRQQQSRFYSGTTPGVSYGRRWRRARASYLAEHPFCVDCVAEGNPLKLAEELDHIVRHEGDYERFWNPANWAGRCRHHHSLKTAREVGLGGRHE